MGRSRHDVLPISTTTFGKLVGATNKYTGEPYDGWRSGYIGCRGLITFRIYPGPDYKINYKDFVTFYPSEPDNLSQRYLRTSTGQTRIIGDKVFEFVTENSVYRFEIGTFDMSVEDMREVYLWGIRGRICDRNDSSYFSAFWNGEKRALLPDDYIIPIDTPIDRDTDYKLTEDELAVIDGVKSTFPDYSDTYSILEPREGAVILDKTKYVGWIVYIQTGGQQHQVVAYRDIREAVISLLFEVITRKHDNIEDMVEPLERAHQLEKSYCTDFWG